MEKLIKKIRSVKLRILLTVFGVLVAPAIAFAVVQSLNGQSGQTQSFANDTNLTITSSGDVHTLGWSGLLPMSRGGTGANSFTNGSILFSNGTTVTQDNANLFWNDATNALTIGGDITANNGSLSKLISTGDSLISGLTVGLGGGSIDSNTAVGKNALRLNSTGIHNTAVGTNAIGDTGHTGSDNTVVGYRTMQVNTTGSDNTVVGSNALSGNSTGNQNTSIGSLSMYTFLSGSNNVALGFASGFGGSSSISNSITIGANVVNAGSNTAVLGDSNVTDVYFGSSVGNAKLHAANIATVSSGTSAPTSTPSALGQIYVDTSAVKVYISTGTSSSSDWTIMN